MAANPLGPCGDDARATGGFPELEAALPQTLGSGGPAPDRVDSGRSCSEAALSTLKAHGVTELRFAGATWEESDSEATVIAVLATPSWVPSLEAAWVEEWYEQGARRGKKTDNIETSRPTMGGAGEVFRVDTLNDLSFQTVVTWQDGGADERGDRRVGRRAVEGADAHDANAWPPPLPRSCSSGSPPVSNPS